jgi:hypothetical protein
MQNFLKYLVKNIVDNPEKVAVEENSDQAGFVNLTIHVDPTDMGKIIGKSGRIIRAVRDLVRILAVKENKRVNVSLAEQ